MRDQFNHWERVTVRWGDMDALGHVNNAKYFTYCESARISYFDLLEFWKYREHDRQGPALVTATCNFRQQVHYRATLEIGARVSEIRHRSLVLEYEIYRQGSGELVADGTSVVAWVDYDINKAIPLPEELRAAIQRFEGMK
jgi:acyl-CoA thioester hydrolase